MEKEVKAVEKRRGYRDTERYIERKQAGDGYLVILNHGNVDP